MLGQQGDDEQAATDLGFPALRHQEHDARRRRATPSPTPPRVAQAVFPSRDDDTRPRAVTLVDATDWRVAVSAAQLMSAPLRAPRPLLRRRRRCPPPPSRRSAGSSRPAPRRPAARRSSASARPRSPRATRPRPSRAPTTRALAQAIDRLQTAAAGKPSPAVVVASSEQPGFSMPAAGWAAKSGDPVLWVTRDAIPPATRAAITAHKRPQIYVLGPESAVSKTVLDQLDELGTARRIARRRPGRQRDRLRALLRRLVRLERRRPRSRARVRDHPAAARRRGGRAALGLRHLRPAPAAHRRPTRSPRRCRTTCSTSSPATTTIPSAASTTTAG